MARIHLKYFGRTMPFTDNTGEHHTASFWHKEAFSIDTNTRILYIHYVAYPSIAAFEAGEESLARKGGSWTQTFTGEAYDRLIEMYAQAVAGVALATWEIADSIKDTPGGEGGFESFFSGAGEIIAPAELQDFFKK